MLEIYGRVTKEEVAKQEAKEFLSALVKAQFDEFKLFLKRYKRKDDEIEKIYERGEFPSAELEEEFAALQEEAAEFYNFFRINDVNIFNSEEWTPLRIYEQLMADAYR